MPYLTTSDLLKLSAEDISQGSSPLLRVPHDLLKSVSGKSHEEKEIEMLRLVPKKLGGYYLVLRLDAFWANGGMQAVALDKHTEASNRLLEFTPVAFELFGCGGIATKLRQILTIASGIARQIDVLCRQEEDDAQFEPLWEKLDSFNDEYDVVFAQIYTKIISDIQQFPHEWTKET